MSKYKIIGILNCFLGSTGILLAITLATVIIPRLFSMYNEMGVEAPSSTYSFANFSYGILFVLAAKSIADIFYGFKLAKKNSDDKLFNINLGLIVTTCAFSGVGVAFLVLSIILPIYKLTSSF
jgi:type II secretory pathway component PulF